jgi:hypothetical protein
MRAGHHFNIIETFKKGDSVRSLTEIDVLVDSYYSVLKLVRSQGLRRGQPVQVISIEARTFFRLAVKNLFVLFLPLQSLLISTPSFVVRAILVYW